MNVKRTIKQVLKKQHEQGVYSKIFSKEAEVIIGDNMDKIAKIAIEDEDIENYLKYQAEDCVRTFLLRAKVDIKEN